MRLLAALAVVLLLAAGFAAFLVIAPGPAPKQDVFLDFAKGTSTRSMAAQLEKAGLIRSSWTFLAARAVRPSAKLQAGEYRFAAGTAASPLTIFDRIARGDVFYYELTVPEGSNIFDVAAIVGRTGLIAQEDFLAVARKPALIRDLDPAASTLEGYLFPSTYRITRRTTAQQLCRQMTDQFRKEWKSAAPAGAEVHRTVTLASLVEKETGVPEERPTVASVYANRLRVGMKLDCDPTTIYAALLEGRYRGVLHRSDLDNGHAYNTYQHTGLPPGPIANPGAASIRAAIKPAQTDYLYFVAKPGAVGSHNFSATYAEHEHFVEAYRRGLKAAP